MQPPLRKHDLWAHQEACYDFCYPKPGAIASIVMGGGKTFVAQALIDNHQCRKVLVACPSSCRGVWRREIAKHAARDYEVAVLDKGSVRKRIQQADAAMQKGKPVIVVGNYEMWWRWPADSWATEQRWDAIIADESHRISNTSKTGEFFVRLGRQGERRYCLSGTPLTRDPVSVYMQTQFCDPTVFPESLDEFCYRYENRYALGLRKTLAWVNERRRQRGEPPRWVHPMLMEGTLHTPEYLERLSKITFRCDKLSVDLPPLTVEKRTFRLNDTAQDIYDSIADGYGYELHTGRWMDVKGSYAITMRLQQVTSGYLPDLKGNPESIDRGKEEALTDILEEAAGEPVVVFTRFVHDLDVAERVAKKLELSYAEISQRRKDATDENGTMRDGIQVAGVLDQAGGFGIDLSKARLCVDYSCSWPPQNFWQKLKRLHRPPQARHVTCYALLAEGTIDEEIYRSIEARQGMIEQVWDSLEQWNQGVFV